MDIKKTLFAALLASVCLGASAKDDNCKADANAPQATTVYELIPHWYVQGQFGGQYTLGELSFGKLVSPNAQIAGGYNFGKVVGLRLAVNAWQSKAGSVIGGTKYKWKWNYVAPTLDATFNISNLISGVNPKRLVDVTAFVGLGVNVAFNNSEAELTNARLIAEHGVPSIGSYTESQYLRLLWGGSKARMVGQAGLIADFKVTKNLSVNAELSANCTTDAYNSKKAGNADWYFNTLVGIKYAFGKIYNERTIEPPVKIIYKDRIVEKVVEKEKDCPPAAVVKERDPLRIDVFFTISSTKLVGSEAQKVNEIANYLQKYPDAKVSITGYADVGTGNAKINRALSEKRAAIVKDELIKKYGIAEDRIITDFKGDTVQPFDVEVLNRVSICIAE